MGRARIIRTPADVATLAAPAGVVPFWAGEHDPEAEPLYVALVATDGRLAAACAVCSHCAAVVLVGSCGHLPAAHVPTVDRVGTVGDDVAHDDLLLVDAGRGIVLVDPSARAVSRFQASSDGSVPRKRYYLDARHQSVRLADGRLVRVGARVRSVDETASALDQGADALLASLDRSHNTPRELARRAAGKPLCFVIEDPRSPIDEALEAAADLDVTLVCGPGPVSAFGSLMDAVQATSEAMTHSDRDWAAPRLGIVLQAGANPERASQHGVERLVAAGPGGGPWTVESEGWLIHATAAARAVVAPVEVIVGSPSTDIVAAVARVGVAGVWTTPDDIAAWKRDLRDLSTFG